MNGQRPVQLNLKFGLSRSLVGLGYSKRRRVSFPGIVHVTRVSFNQSGWEHSKTIPFRSAVLASSAPLPGQVDVCQIEPKMT